MRYLLIAPLAACAVFAQAPDKEAAPPPAAAAPSSAAPSSAVPAAVVESKLKALAEEARTAQPAPKRVIVESLNAAIAANRPCAIPLKNVLPEAAAKADEKILLHVPDEASGRYPAKAVSPPAPSCDDVKR
jgi:hypothetical protein